MQRQTPGAGIAPRRTVPGRLRRDLGFWSTASLSVGGMAPTLAMSVTGVQAARLLGRAAPLAYVLAGGAVVLLAYGFVRLSAAFSHAGSVYAFIGKTLGPRAGFFATWMLIGTYIVFPPVSVLGMAAFTQAFLRHAGIARGADWLPIALICWALVCLLVSRGIKLTAVSVIVVELVSLLLITGLIAIIFLRLGLAHGPARQRLSTDVFKIPPGTGFSTIALAATFGILSFGGFESAISAGEESQRPTQVIPRSIIAAVLFGAVFYVFCISAQVFGFGTGGSGVSQFAHSTAPLGDLARTYVGRGMADLLDIAAILSSLGAALVGVAVASRTLYAVARDRVVTPDIANVSRKTGAPIAAVAVSMALTLVLLLVFGLAGTSALNAFFYLATIGTLSVLVVYVAVSVSAVRLELNAPGRKSWVAIAVPIGGSVVALYVLYRNVVPAPAFPFNLFPYIVAGWVVLGLALALGLPDLSRRIRLGLELH
ncbi:MAG: APC family permease [Solirubrobacteraceae bacterium]